MIRGLKFQSSGEFASCHLDQELGFLSSGEAALAADLIRRWKFQSPGGCTGSRLDQALEISIVWGGCASSQLDQELDFLITLAPQ